jgi:hypothetical protein
MKLPEASNCGTPLGLRLSEGLGRTRAVAALFCRADSHYKMLAEVDVWDEARDARQWPGGVPLVAHPPCRLWAKLRQFAKAADPVMERQLAVDAVRRVQRFGGVLEHPKESTLWPHMGLPTPGRAPDQFGGWTAEIRQCDWGHKAEKKTWLYIVGVHPDDLPPIPGSKEPTHYIKSNRRGYRPSARSLPHVTHAEREHTPPDLALWLVEVARRCQVRPNGI